MRAVKVKNEVGAGSVVFNFLWAGANLDFDFKLEIGKYGRSNPKYILFCWVGGCSLSFCRRNGNYLFNGKIHPLNEVIGKIVENIKVKRLTAHEIQPANL